jgi:SAM-dependent methyltransferase
VTGVDISNDMLQIASGVAAASPHRHRIHLSRQDVTALALPDATMDIAVSVQTLEFVDAFDSALREFFRVLRPGGRLLVVDTDWTALSWHSHNPAGLTRLVEAWTRATAWPSLPQRLPGALRHAGFVNVAASATAVVATELARDRYAAQQFDHMCAVIQEQGTLAAHDLQAIRDEQHQLSAAGDFYLCLVRTAVTANRPQVTD